ncbi:MAG: glycosyltransferase family 4 protein [Rhodospirillaceae bacterium]
MRILQINTLDVQGGAARAAYRLHRGLISVGANSTYFVRDKRTRDETVRKFIPDPSPAAVAHRAACKAELDAAYDAYKDTRSPDIEQFSQERVDGDENFFIQRPRADIINLHWVAGFVDYRLFFTPERIDVPVVWTLHDMNPFTGGCHFDQGCGRFQSRCGACPLLGSSAPEDLTTRIFDSKASIFAGWPADRLHIVAPSHWLVGVARASALFGKYDGTCIPNSIETDLFKPTGKAAARAALGLPQNARIVLFMSHQVGLARKGFRELVQALSLVPDGRDILLIGVGDKNNVAVDGPVRVAMVNYIGDDATVAALYSAADLTAVPSRQDNLPNTMLESMSCGTPVVGFDVGGIPDMVKEGETGFLAPPGNVPALSAAFITAFADRERLAACGRRARALVEERHSPKVQASAYIALYERLLENVRKNRGT